MLDHSPRLYKLLHPAIPDGRTWRAQETWKDAKPQPYDSKHSIYDSKHSIRDSKYSISDSNALFVNQMTQNFLFYGIYVDV